MNTQAFRSTSALGCFNLQRWHCTSSHATQGWNRLQFLASYKRISPYDDTWSLPFLVPYNLNAVSQIIWLGTWNSLQFLELRLARLLSGFFLLWQRLRVELLADGRLDGGHPRVHLFVRLPMWVVSREFLSEEDVRIKNEPSSSYVEGENEWATKKREERQRQRGGQTDR